MQVEFRTPEVPKALRKCDPKPKWAGGDKADQKQAASFVNRLSGWGERCALKVEKIDQILDEAERGAAEANSQAQRK